VYRRLFGALVVTTALVGFVGCTPPAPPKAPAAGSVHVNGRALVDQLGRPVQLRGVNVTGTQYACTDGDGIFDGPSDDASIAAIKSWNANAVRVSLNEDCWLGINGVNPAYSGAAYQHAVADYVGRIRRQGMYVVVNLHRSGPDNQLADSDDQPMPNRRNSPRFWRGVASTFASDRGVLFDLFNEPNPDPRNSAGDDRAAWACVRDGGTCPGVPYTAAGSQELLNAVRSAGAQNVVLVGGPRFAGVLDRWTAYKPVDPLGQLAASIHIYFNTPADPDWSPCYQQSCWDTQIASLARSTPVVIGEFGEHDCSHRLIDGNFGSKQQSLLDWADARGVSYLAWAWFRGSCAEEPSLISGDYARPTATAYGSGVRQHLLSK
jgi:aryl-phospho-beta-D-glucosidase BglC (GH1 family)